MTIDEARAIVRIGAAAAAGDQAVLRDAFDQARDHVHPGHIEEYLLQTYLFAGFPRSINAFYTWQGWAAAHDVTRGLKAPQADPPGSADATAPETWRRRGETLCRLVYGADFEALQRRLERLHPALAEWTLVEGYGKVLSRPGPDPARRELAAIGALLAIGAGRQLASHLKGAIHAGVDPARLRDAVLPVAEAWGTASLVARFLESTGGG